MSSSTIVVCSSTLALGFRAVPLLPGPVSPMKGPSLAFVSSGFTSHCHFSPEDKIPPRLSQGLLTWLIIVSLAFPSVPLCTRQSPANSWITSDTSSTLYPSKAGYLNLLFLPYFLTGFLFSCNICHHTLVSSCLHLETSNSIHENLSSLSIS